MLLFLDQQLAKSSVLRHYQWVGRVFHVFNSPIFIPSDLVFADHSPLLVTHSLDSLMVNWTQSHGGLVDDVLFAGGDPHGVKTVDNVPGSPDRTLWLVALCFSGTESYSLLLWSRSGMCIESLYVFIRFLVYIIYIHTYLMFYSYIHKYMGPHIYSHTRNLPAIFSPSEFLPDSPACRCFPKTWWKQPGETPVRPGVRRWWCFFGIPEVFFSSFYHIYPMWIPAKKYS